jgi:hypothetical protein
VRFTIWALVLTVIFAIGIGALFTAIEVSHWDHQADPRRHPSAARSGEKIYKSFARTDRCACLFTR